MRRTTSLVQVACALMEDPDGTHWGYSLSKRAEVRSGVLYPILTRLLNEKWLTDGWEDPTTIREKRPPRRYYKLTDEGKIQLGALARSATKEARSMGRLGWANG